LSDCKRFWKRYGKCRRRDSKGCGLVAFYSVHEIPSSKKI
jgi:hypothetical protein